MKITVNLPQNTTLNERKIKDLDTLLTLFSPEELRQFYQQKQHTMHITTKEDMELKDAIGNLLNIIS